MRKTSNERDAINENQRLLPNSTAIPRINRHRNSALARGRKREVACLEGCRLWDNSELGYPLFTVRKRSLRRLCFYMCLSVHRGGLGPDPGGGWGVQAQAHGGWCLGPGLGVGVCIPACTEADKRQKNTAADGTHPTGMHYCYHYFP